MNLSERERQILATIIESFIETAAPVASRAVARRSGLALSPASMRSVMADLTDRGLLEQPHTSAGRVPTPEGFRLYVDSLLALSPLPAGDRSTLAVSLGGPEQEIGELLRRAGKLLANRSHQASMVLAPRYASVQVKRLEFVLVKDTLVLAILVLAGGMVQQRLIEVDPGVNADDLVYYANYLNELFANRTLTQVRAHILAELQHARDNLSDACRRALTMAGQAIARDDRQEIYVDGTAHIVRQPEFTDVRSICELLDVLDEQTTLLDILDRVMHSGGVQITLGKEMSLAPFSDVSLVSSPYSAHGQPMGLVSVIGPMRMDYAKVVPMVELMSQAITDALDKRF